jgi:4'-phosphopantetheinyl transferase
MKLALDPLRIDLWCTFYDTIAAVTIDSYREMLSNAEREQAARFRFEDGQKRYIATRALVRTTLSRYFSHEPADWKFDTNAFGRPGIDSADASVRGVDFNVSHTRGLIVMAVAADEAVGVDVENASTRRADPGLAERFFSASEAHALRGLPESEQPGRFLDYWTLKESYIKARGEGLSLPLDSFGFDLSRPGLVSLRTTAIANDDPQRWRFRQIALKDSPHYHLALCVTRRDAPGRLQIRNVVPSVSESPLPFEVLRASH